MKLGHSDIRVLYQIINTRDYRIKIKWIIQVYLFDGSNELKN